MGIRGLAEGIILQSLDDLWDEGEKLRSIYFFKGDGFNKCAQMAGMKLPEQIKLLNIVKKIVKQDFAKSKRVHPKQNVNFSHSSDINWKTL